MSFRSWSAAAQSCLSSVAEAVSFSGGGGRSIACGRESFVKGRAEQGCNEQCRPFTSRLTHRVRRRRQGNGIAGGYLNQVGLEISYLGIILAKCACFRRPLLLNETAFYSAARRRLLSRLLSRIGSLAPCNWSSQVRRFFLTILATD